MSPAPKAPAADANATPAEPTVVEVLRERIDAIPEDERTSGERQFIRANDLEKQRGDLMKLIAANRDYLRLMEQNEELDDDLAEWLDDFYPQKERGSVRSDDEIERTKLAKAAARKVSKTNN